MTHMTSGTQEWVYLYTADDERIWMYNIAVNNSRWTIRDLGGKVLREYLNNRGWSVGTDYIYRDGLLLAAETQTGQRHFHLDHLGTPRLITRAGGERVAYHVYYPFGEEATAFNQDSERMKFTGHERDLASATGAGDDLDYMHARHESPVTGRFLSVDAGPVELAHPQIWNRYAYVLDNPMIYVDPGGEIVSLSGLTEEQRKKLLDQLDDFTGNLYGSDKNGNLVLVNVGSGSSLAATNFLNTTIKSETVYPVVSSNGANRWNPDSHQVEINFNSFGDAKYGRVDQRTFNLGSTLVHELYHGVTGQQDLNNGVFTMGLGWTGPVVDFENKIRSERGLPLRESYGAERSFSGKQKVRFNHVDPKHPEQIFYVIRKSFGD